MSAGTGFDKSSDPDAVASELKVEVEVAYATPERQLIVKLCLDPGATVAQAIEASALRGQFPEIGAQPVVGIFSKKVALNHELDSGDRVEIYRPLLADPKEARRKKVAKERERALSRN